MITLSSFLSVNLNRLLQDSISKMLMLCIGVKQTWQLDTNNAKTALRLLLHVCKTKLRHLTIKWFHSSEKTYMPNYVSKNAMEMVHNFNF